MARDNKWTLTPYGKWLKITLVERGMTAGDLAKMCGISQQRISEVMYGVVSTGYYCPRIEQALGVEPPADIAS